MAVAAVRSHPNEKSALSDARDSAWKKSEFIRSALSVSAGGGRGDDGGAGSKNDERKEKAE